MVRVRGWVNGSQDENRIEGLLPEVAYLETKHFQSGFHRLGPLIRCIKEGDLGIVARLGSQPQGHLTIVNIDSYQRRVQVGRDWDLAHYAR